MAQDAFKTLKNTLASTPILALPNFTTSFMVKANTSGMRVGDVLIQHDQLVTYFSLALPIIAHSHSAYEWELITIVMTIHH